jgi:hypothetical protein
MEWVTRRLLWIFKEHPRIFFQGLWKLLCNGRHTEFMSIQWNVSEQMFCCLTTYFNGTRAELGGGVRGRDEMCTTCSKDVRVPNTGPWTGKLVPWPLTETDPAALRRVISCMFGEKFESALFLKLPESHYRARLLCHSSPQTGNAHACCSWRSRGSLRPVRYAPVHLNRMEQNKVIKPLQNVPKHTHRLFLWT